MTDQKPERQTVSTRGTVIFQGVEYHALGAAAGTTVWVSRPPGRVLRIANQYGDTYAPYVCGKVEPPLPASQPFGEFRTGNQHGTLRQLFGSDFCSVSIEHGSVRAAFTLTREELARLVDCTHAKVGSHPLRALTLLFNPTEDAWRIISRDLTVSVPHALLKELRTTPLEPCDPASSAALPLECAAD